MQCEICDTQPATMWVEKPALLITAEFQSFYGPAKPIVSCDDCGPQLGYKILAPLTSVQCHG